MPLYTTPMTEADDVEASQSEAEVTVVLAAVDTSTLASRVVDLAAQMARRTWANAQLHLVHVFRVGRYDRPSSVGLRSEDLRAEAMSHLDFHVRMARRQFPKPVVGHFVEGDPADQVLKCARALNADIVLVGTHDRVGLEKLLLGSVAAKVAKAAHCPVVIVRQKQRPYIKAT
jgi:nucleotide-binding universal stress UspA family protein